MMLVALQWLARHGGRGNKNIEHREVLHPGSRSEEEAVEQVGRVGNLWGRAIPMTRTVRRVAPPGSERDN